MKDIFLRKILFSNIKKNSIYLGIVKGYNVPMLPKKIETIYNNIYIRMLRFIGGLCLLLVLTSHYSWFPIYLQIIIIIVGAIQSIQIFIILFIKIIYGIYTIIYKPKIFEVRN